MLDALLRRYPIRIGAGIVLALTGAAAAWLFVREAPPLRIATDDPAVLAAGAEIYAQHCAICHGADLEGEPQWRQRRQDGTLPAPPHDASGHTWHHSDADLFAMTRYGIGPFAPEGYVSNMPAFAEVLEDAEILAVIAFIKSRWPDEIRRLQERLNR